MKHALAISLLAVCLPAAAFCQAPRDLLDPKIRELLHESLSGELAKEHVIAITRHHRIQASRGYRDAAHYVLDQLRRAGFSDSDAYIESFRSDGKKQYQTWQSPSGWDIRAAELRMVEPDSERIVGYPEIAMSVITYSNPGDVTAPLIWVGEGTNDDDYRGKDVRGKFVLATGYGGDVHRKAVLKYGARAIVCYLDDARAKQHPDMLQYTGMWPRAEELGRVTFGFNLSKRQGDRLKELLLAGKKVVLHGWIKGTGLEPYYMDVVVAHIRGSQRRGEELVASAHLDHPKESANDNASGSGAILDMARAFHELIDSGRLARPQRSFRFLWVPEWHGTMAYIDKHPELRGPELDGAFLANLNMDMVGEHPELVHSHLILTRTPASLPSCLNEVVENMAEMVDGMDIRTPRGSLSEFNYRVTPYSGGSDHMMFIDRKIPAVMFSHTDYTHHTSEDTPDKVDPVELERCEMIAAGSLFYLANLDAGQATDLADLVHAKAAERLGLASRKAHQQGRSASQDSIPFDIRRIVERELVQGRAALQSIRRFQDSKDISVAIEGLTQALEQQYESLTRPILVPLPVHSVGPPEVPPVTRVTRNTPDTRVPLRLTRGPLDFRLPESKLDSTGAAWYESKKFPLDEDMRFELVNFIDGKRSVADIRESLCAEFHPVAPEIISRYVDDLVKAGVLAWK